jgi:hypothetical protein
VSNDVFSFFRNRFLFSSSTFPKVPNFWKGRRGEKTNQNEGWGVNAARLQIQWNIDLKKEVEKGFYFRTTPFQTTFQKF